MANVFAALRRSCECPLQPWHEFRVVIRCRVRGRLSACKSRIEAETQKMRGMRHVTRSRYGAMTWSCRSRCAKRRISRLPIRLRARAKPLLRDPARACFDNRNSPPGRGRLHRRQIHCRPTFVQHSASISFRLTRGDEWARRWSWRDVDKSLRQSIARAAIGSRFRRP